MRGFRQEYLKVSETPSSSVWLHMALNLVPKAAVRELRGYFVLFLFQYKFILVVKK